MIRKYFVASLFWLALCAGLTALPAVPGSAETLVVHNTTKVRAWITLYRDAGISGWSIFYGPKPQFVEPGGWFSYNRGHSESNGPWRLRFEANSNGKHYDTFTTFWYDGSQHKYNKPGDPNSAFFICENAGGMFWSISPKCDQQSSN